MAERSEATEPQAVRNASARYSVEAGTASAEDVPPGYKRTEVGVIPEDWEMTALRHGVSLLSGHHVMARFCNTTGHGVPYLTGPADFPDGNIQQTKFTTKPTTICKTGNLLLTVKGSGAGTLIKSDAEYCISRQLMAIHVEKWDPVFIFYSLLQNASALSDAVTGLIPGLSRGDVLSQLLPLPAEAKEQHAIATALSDADALIGSLDRLIAKKRTIKQAAMQQLLTGQTRLPGFTGDWETKRLGDLFTIRVATSKARHITHGGQFLIVDMGSVSRSGQLIASKPTNYQGDYLAKGELVMPKDDIGGGGIIGKVAFIDANHRYILGDHVYALTIKEGNPRFFSYQINSYKVNTALRSKVSGSAQLGLARTAVLEQELHTPAAEEQAAIATVLSDMDTEIEALERRRDKARQIKQGMMQQLLTGRVRLVQSKNQNGSESSRNAGKRTQGLVS